MCGSASPFAARCLISFLLLIGLFLSCPLPPFAAGHPYGVCRSAAGGQGGQSAGVQCCISFSHFQTGCAPAVVLPALRPRHSTAAPAQPTFGFHHSAAAGAASGQPARGGHGRRRSERLSRTRAGGLGHCCGLWHRLVGPVLLPACMRCGWLHCSKVSRCDPSALLLGACVWCVCLLMGCRCGQQRWRSTSCAARSSSLV